MSPPTAQIEDIYPLTPAQQGILFHAVRDPESDVYFEQSSVTLEGTLDVPAFRRAWERVVERHAVLRSAFDSQQSDPLQIVHREVTLHWEQLDWADLPAAEQESQLEQFLLADRRRGFELSRPPLMRMTIIRCGERLHEFVWSHHHLLLDGWSSHLVQREVREFYEAFCRGEEREVARPPQFREYVAWLANRDASQDEAFWRGRLRGFTSPTRLPHRAEGPYTVNRITLSASATSALEAFARTNRLTLNSIVQ